LIISVITIIHFYGAGSFSIVYAYDFVEQLTVFWSLNNNVSSNRYDCRNNISSKKRRKRERN